MAIQGDATDDATYENLRAAVHRNKAWSMEGARERIFTHVFTHLVYPQIWEDPRLDLEALRVRSTDTIVTIASGGCNVASYLTADPKAVIAIDMNAAHIALNRLKLTAIAHLPTHEALTSFFTAANRPENLELYEWHVRPRLDRVTRSYWDSRDALFRRRITAFSKGFYRHGVLGRFIGAGHGLARLYGVDLKRLLDARTVEEQRAFFDEHVAPLFDKRLVAWMTRRPSSLYGLGIPPAQYRELAGGPPSKMRDVLCERLRKLACDFPISDNYFAWQAFGRSYDQNSGASLPPYLEAANYAAVKSRTDRVRVEHDSYTGVLRKCRDASLDCYVLLDAQDWMSDQDLTILWSEITRTARSGARVIFRTAGEHDILPGRVPESLLEHWQYDPAHCRALSQRDRSAIYGAFHLYESRA